MLSLKVELVNNANMCYFQCRAQNIGLLTENMEEQCLLTRTDLTFTYTETSISVSGTLSTFCTASAANVIKRTVNMQRLSLVHYCKSRRHSGEARLLYQVRSPQRLGPRQPSKAWSWSTPPPAPRSINLLQHESAGVSLLWNTRHIHEFLNTDWVVFRHFGRLTFDTKLIWRGQWV